MSEIIAYCGILCNECPGYKATVQNDDSLREKTAEEWKKFSPDIKAEDINCLGCKSDTVFGYCKVCEIRACGMEKELENCAGCSSYGCDKLESFLKNVPEVRERLEKLRK